MDCQYPATGQHANKKSTMSCTFIFQCHSAQQIFGNIGQPSYWSDHRKLFLYLGLLRNDQDHSDMGGKAWTDAIFKHPGLRARQLVNVLNDMSVGFTYSDEVWEEEELPFSMDAEINPKSD